MNEPEKGRERERKESETFKNLEPGSSVGKVKKIRKLKRYVASGIAFPKDMHFFH